MGHEPVTGGALPSSREAIETEVERLIDLLDLMDGDTDLEPSLGYCGEYTDMDLERDDADDEPNGDLEPSLGSLNPPEHLGYSQTAWAAGACDDLEEGHDGREPDESSELWEQPATLDTTIEAFFVGRPVPTLHRVKS